MSDSDRLTQIREWASERAELAKASSAMAGLKSQFEHEMTRAQRHWVPEPERDALRARFNDAGTDRSAAESVLSDLTAAIEAAAMREQQQMAACGLTPADVVAKIEARGLHKLRLGEGGAIECVGGMPTDRRLVLALRHYADGVRGVLAERERVVVLVGGA